MRGLKCIAPVALAVVLLAWLVWAHLGVSSGIHQNAVITNLRQLDGAKQQWKLEKEPSSDSWPTRADMTRYMAPRGATTFEECLPTLDGEIYIINRADRPVSVYLTKDSFGFREGQLLTIEDFEKK